MCPQKHGNVLAWAFFGRKILFLLPGVRRRGGRSGGIMAEKSTLDQQTINAIENVLATGQRVELIPVKDGVKVVKVKRETVGFENHKAR